MLTWSSALPPSDVFDWEWAKIMHHCPDPNFSMDLRYLAWESQHGRHSLAVIAGDFLYLRAVQELVRLGDMEPLRIFAQASNELTLGEMRQLGALDALSFSEDDYEFLAGVGTESLYAVEKMLYTPPGAAAAIDYGVVTGLVASAI